jgi:hypothetical protein
MTGMTVMIIHSGLLPETLRQLLGLQLGGRLGDLDAEVGGDLFEVEREQHVADGFGADLGSEAVGTILVLRIEILLFSQQLVGGERREAGIEDDVLLEVEDALDVLERHIEQERDTGRQGLEEPDVGDGRGELDMAHALAANARQRDFNAALLADDALELHALVLAAQALIVLHGPEDARAEQAVTLRLERAVVDGFRLFDLAIGPAQDLLGRGDRDFHLIEHLHRDLRVERVHDVVVSMHLVISSPQSGLSGKAESLTRRVSKGRANSANYSAAF